MRVVSLGMAVPMRGSDEQRQSKMRELLQPSKTRGNPRGSSVKVDGIHDVK